MGLSNKERRSKIWWAILQIQRKARDLEKGDRLGAASPAILNRIRDLWHAFLSGNRDSTFWLLGSSGNAEVYGSESPWGAALEILFERAHQDHKEACIGRAAHPREFDPFDDALTVGGLLKARDRQQALIHEIYTWTEALAYALRRYDDDFRDQYPEMDRIISDIYGLCFEHFTMHPDYAKAYAGHRLLKALWVVEGFKEAVEGLHLHHALRSAVMEARLSKLLEWDRWWLTHDQNLQNALFVILSLAGRRFHYDHEFKRLMGKVKGTDVSEKLLQAVFEKNKKAHKEHEEESKSYCEERDFEAVAVVHGYRFASDHLG